MKQHTLSDLEFTLEWTSPFAKHTDIYHVQDVDPSQDEFPLNFGEKISQLKVDESCNQTFQARDLLHESFSTEKVIPFQADLFNTHFKGQNSPPMLYRFYPSAIAWQGLDTLKTDYTPFRLISSNEENMVANRNHPLAKYYLSLTASKTKEHPASGISDRPKKNISKLITSKGPGMQAPFEYGEPVFFDKYPFDKGSVDETDDQEHLKPQLGLKVTEQISTLYSKLLPKHSKVLDLMSCESSYLEKDYETGLLVGIGANEKALCNNHRLNTYDVQNLNNDLILPFEVNSFDDAICTCSIESLIDPLKIVQEVARVVSSGGKFIITFSGNTPATNSIKLWSELHPFERIQLVLEYFRHTGKFKDLNTLSNRGMMRSINSKSKNDLSDPFYAVWGNVV